MKRVLPTFAYHPEPLKTGSVKESPAQCTCCGQASGYIYVASIYSRLRSKIQICPWCIADGSAAAKYQAAFSDSHPLLHAEVPQSVVEEVTTRTPGYNSWQQESWLVHCGDACEFHGDASREDLEQMPAESKASIFKLFGLTEQRWASITQHYIPGGDPAIYRFVCRHCHIALYGMDFS